jgi:hypothetical protein
MTDTTALIVIKVPGEDYLSETGNYIVAVDLAVQHGGTEIGGGTCLLTGISDIEIEIPLDNAPALVAALDAAELSWTYYDDES